MDDQTSISMNVPLAAVMDMYNDSIWKALQTKINPRSFLVWVASNFAEAGEPVPGWITAGIRCEKDRHILPVCTQSYLAGWAPKQA